MKAAKVLGVAVLIYVGGVVAFESLLGWIQPEPDRTFVLTTFEADGTAHDRVVSRLDSGGQLYVAANHWPRAWFTRAQANPEVVVRDAGETRDYVAVPVEAAEHERVDQEHALGFGFRLSTGFPPREFLRLDPR